MPSIVINITALQYLSYCHWRSKLLDQPKSQQSHAWVKRHVTTLTLLPLQE